MFLIAGIHRRPKNIIIVRSSYDFPIKMLFGLYASLVYIYYSRDFNVGTTGHNIYTISAAYVSTTPKNK